MQYVDVAGKTIHQWLFTQKNHGYPFLRGLKANKLLSRQLKRRRQCSGDLERSAGGVTGLPIRDAGGLEGSLYVCVRVSMMTMTLEVNQQM